MKRLCILLLVTAFIFTFAGTVFAFDVSVFVDDNKVSFPDQKPFIDENARTLVPIRFIAEEMGAEVGWDGKTELVTIEKEGVLINLTIGEQKAQVNEAWKTFDTKAMLKNARTMVPLRFISETIGAAVEWDENTKTVYIRTDGESVESSQATQDLTEQDEARIKTYQARTKEYMESLGATILIDDYLTFEEHYAQYPQGAMITYNGAMEIYQNYFKNAEVNFISDPKLVYQTYDTYYGVRGVLQIKQKSLSPAIVISNTREIPIEGLTSGQWYEADVEFINSYTAIDKDTIGWKIRFINLLSEFTPVTR